jgi:hypothetical protein
MKIRTLLGLAAVGGVAYAHQKRGGEWTLDGIKDTVRSLFSGAQDKVRDLADQAKDKMGQRDIGGSELGSRSTGYGIGGSDVTGYNR